MSNLELSNKIQKNIINKGGSDSEKEKEKKRWEQIRKKFTDKKRRESKYKKTIRERDESKKERLSPIHEFESEENDGGKNKTIKQKKIRRMRSLKKQILKRRGGVAPLPPRRSLEGRIPQARPLQEGLDQLYTLRLYTLIYINNIY